MYRLDREGYNQSYCLKLSRVVQGERHSMFLAETVKFNPGSVEKRPFLAHGPSNEFTSESKTAERIVALLA